MIVRISCAFWNTLNYHPLPCIFVFYFIVSSFVLILPFCFCFLFSIFFFLFFCFSVFCAVAAGCVHRRTGRKVANKPLNMPSQVPRPFGPVLLSCRTQTKVGFLGEELHWPGCQFTPPSSLPLPWKKGANNAEALHTQLCNKNNSV